jgi:hypothetical protein
MGGASKLPTIKDHRRLSIRSVVAPQVDSASHVRVERRFRPRAPRLIHGPAVDKKSSARPAQRFKPPSWRGVRPPSWREYVRRPGAVRPRGLHAMVSRCVGAHRDRHLARHELRAPAVRPFGIVPMKRTTLPAINARRVDCEPCRRASTRFALRAARRVIKTTSCSNPSRHFANSGLCVKQELFAAPSCGFVVSRAFPDGGIDNQRIARCGGGTAQLRGPAREPEIAQRSSRLAQARSNPTSACAAGRSMLESRHATSFVARRPPAADPWPIPPPRFKAFALRRSKAAAPRKPRE